MAGDKKSGPTKPASKAGAGVTIDAAAEEVKKKKRTNPMEFLQQVRAEAEKVTWTTWSETWVSTVMVLIMVVVMAVFFLVVDQGIRLAVCTGLPIDCASQN